MSVLTEHCEGMQGFEGWYLLEVGLTPVVYSKNKQFVEMIAAHKRQQGEQVLVVFKEAA